MESLNYKISWDGFNDHIVNAFNQLKNRTEFSDVTLACDDGRKFSAHKMVLRSSSSVLREILSHISLNGSLIFLRGINHKCLEALLDFLYQGEVDIPENEMEMFLMVAKELKISGLSQFETLENLTSEENNENYGGNRPQNEAENHQKENESFQSEEENREFLMSEFETQNPENENEISEHEEERPEYMNEYSEQESVNFQTGKKSVKFDNKNSHQQKHQLNEMIQFGSIPLKLEPVEVSHSSTKSPCLFRKENDFYLCNSCDYKSLHDSSVRRHIKVKHEGVSFSCLECDYKSGTFYSLKVHQMTKHEGIRHECDVCEYTASKAHTLNNHKKTIHEGIKLLCELSSYEASTTTSMKRHVQAKHNGVKLKCGECDYKTMHPGSLYRHTRYNHRGIRYMCDECDFQGSQSSVVKKHKRSKHENK